MIFPNFVYFLFVLMDLDFGMKLFNGNIYYDRDTSLTTLDNIWAKYEINPTIKGLLDANSAFQRQHPLKIQQEYTKEHKNTRKQQSASFNQYFAFRQQYPSWSK